MFGGNMDINWVEYGTQKHELCITKAKSCFVYTMSVILKHSEGDTQKQIHDISNS